MRALAAALLLAAPALAATTSGERSEEALRESVLRLAAGDVAGAENQAKAAVAADPESVRALQQLARAANAALDFRTAEDAASAALARGDAAPALLCLRSEARSGRGDYQGALDDAQRAAHMNPASGQAALRAAVAKEGLRRSPEETIAEYRHAAELDPALAPLRDSAEARLSPPRSTHRGLGGLIALLGFAALVGWSWGRFRRVWEAAPAPSSPEPRPALAGEGRLAPREALKALAAAAESAGDADGARALAESLYERLTGVPPFPPEEADIARRMGRFSPPSRTAKGLPIGLDAFFERALNPEPSRRFQNGVELCGAFRSLVDPPID